MKKNAFTLIEVLAVIIIISVIAVLVVPNFINSSANSKEKIYQNKIAMLEKAAEMYVQDNYTDILKNHDEEIIDDGNLSYVIRTIRAIDLVPDYYVSEKDGKHIIDPRNNGQYLDDYIITLSVDVKNRKYSSSVSSSYLKLQFHGTNSVFGKNIDKSKFESITILDNNIVPSDAIASWKADVFDTGTIMAWYKDDNKNSLYELYIGQNGGVIANPSSNYAFANFTNATSIDVNKLLTSDVKNMSYMFAGDNIVKKLELKNFNTGKVEKMIGMFWGTNALTSLNVSSFDTSKVNDMHNMFIGINVSELNLSNFDTSNVTNMAMMFAQATNLINLDISSFNTKEVIYMNSMFNGLSKIRTIDLTSFDTSNVTNMASMFNNSNKLKTIYA